MLPPVFILIICKLYKYVDYTPAQNFFEVFRNKYCRKYCHFTATVILE